ncbi:uncharacterized protein E0L32_000104 [Thyridium curvatum]|uniref:Pleckstrin homology domain-containing protein n=1 Tax=Thyridium curvatum TaxID=1093900 RepID=A0A507BGV6_9PEZI|nr:uncharacterized protein E0L32_000104 [Thyridium curvatum]TPX15770.1 hypothetical protein E0L32_000104 [Thyridium curvatum]
MSSMAVWETEDEYGGTDVPTEHPTSPETPFRTASRNSKKSRRSVTPPGKKSPPPPIPGTDKTDKSSKRSSKDIATDETLSILDPRRFTPTLHANLVSEILALRRDQEEKTKIIESLETSLHTTREEQESLQTTLTTTSKESRSLKRQLALLEGGTSSALGELARERDEAVDTATETKKRLDAVQKRLRVQEDDSQRVHEQWAKEKDEWEEEKRKFERKVHVAESRLKMLLDEVAAFQAAQANGFQHAPESETDDAGKDNDAASVRTMSMTNSVRFSVVTAGRPVGHSLADELNFDGETDYETDPGGRESVLSNHANNFHMRNTSRDSAFSKTHRRNHSNDSLIRPGSVARGRFLNQAVLERLEDGIIKEDEEEMPPPARKVSYADSAVQYSPPPSPTLLPSKPSTPEPPAIPTRLDRAQEVETSPRGDWEIEANQRRKRVYIARPLTIEPVTATKLMVSSAAQTAEEPLSPPKTPKSPYAPESPVSVKRVSTVMVSSSTQTDMPPPLEKPALAPPAEVPMLIPSISIHPPTSRPTTPREPRLPQLFKDFGCQVNFSAPVPSKSTAVQTEEIRVDTRLDRLPAHLHPSTITSRPTSPAAPEPIVDDPTKSFTPVPGALPPRNPRRLTTKRSLTDLTSSPPAAASPAAVEETHDTYPGNNDDGPLSSQKAPMRRPPRISSLFAGFDGNSSDEVDEFADIDMSDSEYRTALSAPKPKSGSSRSAKRSSGGTVLTSPEQPSLPRKGSGRSSMKQIGGPETYSKYSLSDGRDSRDSVVGRSSKAINRGYEKPSSIGSSNKSSVMRKAAMIQNGIATHSRARSPSLPDPQDPPFPIPTRASSRKPPVSVSAPSDGQQSPTRGEAWHRRGVGRSHYRAGSIRKVRSAANLPRNQRSRRQGSRSPPPFSELEEPESPGLPPLPSNDITSPRYPGSKYKTHQHQPSTNTNTTGGESLGSSNQATGVVDAIAQTMVGEWMHKYVRRRKSFGVADSGKDDSSNDRHKRWVWLAPYERAILWSSKQPSSNSTLMGKSGRKLTIQSVLDVKDDNPPPKGVTQLFNRSILILTPQRALKFTAASAERHYIWLTSLSFLAHSQQAVPDIVAQMNPPKQLPEFDSRPKGRKAGIRDSIRLAKGKANAPRGPMSAASSHTDSVPPSIPSYRIPESVVSVPYSAPYVPSVAPSAYSAPYSVPSVPPSVSAPSTHTRDLSRDTAEPPAIPRFHDRVNHTTVHGRKRSNTGGHVPPPLSFRGFSGPLSASSSYHHASTNSTAGNSDISQSQGSTNNMTWAMSTGSQRTSEASSRPSGAAMNNFFDAIGTVRMEAFISPLAFSRFDGGDPDEQEEMRYRARRRSKEIRRRASRSRHRDSYQSRGGGARGDEYYASAGGGGGGSRTAGEEDYFFRDDPFKGF